MSMEMAHMTTFNNFIQKISSLIVDINSLKNKMTCSKDRFSFEVQKNFEKVLLISNDFLGFINSNVINTLKTTINTLTQNIVSNEDLLTYINSLYNILCEIKKDKTKEYNKMCAKY